MIPDQLFERLRECGARVSGDPESPRVDDFGSPGGEYLAALTGAGLYPATNRRLVQITGKDRAAWLHNLTTNAIKTLQTGDGNYTFATNVKGRILFDLNVLVLADALWVDLHRTALPKALAHFERYVIMEDVQVEDRSDAFVRFGLLGPKAAEVADALGATQAGAMASLGSTWVPLVRKKRLLVRHDFAGVFGIELFIETGDAAECWDRLLEIGRPIRLAPVGYHAVRTLRMEAGLPSWPEDINEEVLPAETQQIERAISYVKGCYLGQEVVERMRAHGALARKLTGFRLSAPIEVPPGGQPLKAGEVDAGRITSACHSEALSGPIALGYLKTAHAKPGNRLSVPMEPPVTAEVVELPFRKAAK